VIHGRLQVFADARVGDHAAVPDQHHPRQPEPLLQLVHLGRQRRRVPGLARERLDGDRTALPVAEQAIDDLRPIGPLVPAVAVPGQFAAAPLQIGRADVVQHQGALGQTLLGQATLDPLLPIAQPIQRRIDLPGLDRRRRLPGQPEHQAQAGARRLQRQRPQGRKLRARRDYPGHDQRQRQIAQPRLGRVQPAAGDQPVQTQVPQQPQHRGHIAVRQGAPDLYRLAGLGKGHATLQQGAQALDHRHRQLRQIALSRSSTAGGEFRLGTTSTNIVTENQP
jgi:hypothetical protein